MLTGPRTRSTLRRRLSNPPSKYKSHHEHVGVGEARGWNMEGRGVCLYVGCLRVHLYRGPGLLLQQLIPSTVGTASGYQPTSDNEHPLSSATQPVCCQPYFGTVWIRQNRTATGLWGYRYRYHGRSHQRISDLVALLEDLYRVGIVFCEGNAIDIHIARRRKNSDKIPRARRLTQRKTFTAVGRQPMVVVSTTDAR